MSLLKKWVGIFKTLLKQYYNKLPHSEQKLVEEFYFSFGEPLDILRRLMGFVKEKNKEGIQFAEVDDCRMIRTILIQVLDSPQILSVIENSNSKQAEKI